MADDSKGGEAAGTATLVTGIPASPVDAAAEELGEMKVSQELSRGPQRAAELDESTGAVQIVRPADQALFEAATRFDDPSLRLSEPLIKGVHNYGWSHPSRIQAQTLPYIFGSNRNILAQSKAGSGKTGCFALAMLGAIDASVDKPQALCLVPTRELATQIAQVTMELGKYTGVKIACVLGGQEFRQPLNAQIVIGTTGKVQALNLHKPCLLDLRQVKLLVFDEADYMMEHFSSECSAIRAKVRDARVLLFSATFDAMANQTVRKFTSQILNVAKLGDPLRIIAEDDTSTLKSFWIRADNEEDKLGVLLYLFTAVPLKSIVFCNTRERANWLTTELRKNSMSVGVLCGGSLKQEDRVKVLQAFRSGVISILVATNVMARGIDDKDVKCVVNYDMPTVADIDTACDITQYTHRVGRTARKGRKGVSINIVADERTRRMQEQLLVKFPDLSELDSEDAEACGKAIQAALEEVEK